MKNINGFQQPRKMMIAILAVWEKHNVVIVFPGSDAYGRSATQTAANMVRTFCNIRFGLMVGVGVGAPKPPDPKDPLKDIRLGDVVVSDSKGNHGKHAPRSRPSVTWILSSVY
jgi:hypothetical protein